MARHEFLTGAYCKARKRLPERFFSRVARHTGKALENRTDARWLWKGRRVYVYNGSPVTMPDTQENQLAYSRWFRGAVKDSYLAEQAERIERRRAGWILSHPLDQFLGRGSKAERETRS